MDINSLIFIASKFDSDLNLFEFLKLYNYVSGRDSTMKNSTALIFVDSSVKRKQSSKVFFLALRPAGKNLTLEIANIS